MSFLNVLLFLLICIKANVTRYKLDNNLLPETQFCHCSIKLYYIIRLMHKKVQCTTSKNFLIMNLPQYFDVTHSYVVFLVMKISHWQNPGIDVYLIIFEVHFFYSSCPTFLWSADIIMVFDSATCDDKIFEALCTTCPVI